EIADVLNENVNTVKTRLYAGLKKLRIAMDEKNEEVLI
ncbi:MAG TPA: RNA polymerase subunit sigma-70, partial [Tepidanaerobacter syntrophicus]|nr:RNA polymerase subunit sigma-70 [Tepidanaerobacter syntrophicus]HHV83776.1 RNA polymerase subunit sigma-70 [Tepidanaerobacter syntrophicus]